MEETPTHRHDLEKERNITGKIKNPRRTSQIHKNKADTNSRKPEMTSSENIYLM